MTKIFGQQVESLEQANSTAKVFNQRIEFIQTQNNPSCHVVGQTLEFVQTKTNPSCHVVGQSMEFSQTTVNPSCHVVGQFVDFIEATPSVVRTQGVYMEVLRTPDDVQKRSSPIVVTAS